MTRSAAPATTNPYTLSSARRRRTAPAIVALAAAARCRSWPASAAASRSPSCRDRRHRRSRRCSRRSSSAAPSTPTSAPATSRRAAFRPVCSSCSTSSALRRHLHPDADDGRASGGDVLFALRNALFTKLQELPLDFFNQNKAGDLISRINNDTDKLNQFFAQSAGAAGGQPVPDGRRRDLPGRAQPRLGLAALVPALGVLHLTRATGAVGQAEERQEPAVARRPERRDPGEPRQLQGHRRVQPPRLLPAEVRRGQPARNYSASVASGLASNIFMPIYGLAYNLAQIIVLLYGIHLDRDRQRHGRPADRVPAVRQQLLPAAAAAGGRVVVVPARAGGTRSHLGGAGARIEHAGAPGEPVESGRALLAFDHVGFSYPGGQRGAARRLVRARARQDLRAGRTDRRRQDDDRLADGAALRPDARARAAGRARHPHLHAGGTDARIGFILQEPFLFTGTIRDNILYGNSQYAGLSDEQLMQLAGRAQPRRAALAVRGRARHEGDRERRRRSASARSS